MLQPKINFFRFDRQVFDAHAEGVVNRVGDRRRDGDQRALADAFRTERAVSIGHLDANRIDHRRHITERRQNVIDQVRIDQLSVVVGDLFEHRLADPGDRGAGKLLAAAERIERLADVDRRRIFKELEFSGVDVALDFRGTGSEKPECRSALFAEFVFDGSFDLSLADQCAALHAEALEHHLGIIQLRFRQANLAVGKNYLIFRNSVFLRDDLLEPAQDVLRRQLHGFTHVKGRAARRSRQIVRHDIGVDAEHLDFLQWNRQLLTGNLRQYGFRALPHLDGTTVDGETRVLVELHYRT